MRSRGDEGELGTFGVSEKYEKENTKMNTHPPIHFSISQTFSNILKYSLMLTSFACSARFARFAHTREITTYGRETLFSSLCLG